MRRRIARGLAVALLAVGLGAAHAPHNSEAIPDQGKLGTKNEEVVKTQAYQVGTASWYGSDFVGKPTANGESYDMYAMTAAHPTLPLGSYVRVTNLHNGRAVVVRVNDRGPIVPGRIIDLSYGAASALKYDKKGLQRVRLDLVRNKNGEVAQHRARQPEAKLQTIAYSGPLPVLPLANLP
jgi:rare lipoprotein A